MITNLRKFYLLPNWHCPYSNMFRVTYKTVDLSVRSHKNRANIPKTVVDTDETVISSVRARKM